MYNIDERLFKKIAYDYGESNFSILEKLSYNSDIGSTFEDVWNVGGLLTYPSTAGKISVSSSSTSDTSAGTGARTIKIIGLDSNYDRLEETITMNGTSTVTSTNNFLRINSAYVVTSGSNETNVGDITFVIGGNNQGVISATIGQTQRSHFTVPKGFRLFLIGFEANSTSNAEFEVHLMSKTFGESWLVRNRTFLNNEHVVSNITGIVLNEKTEIRFHAKSSSANKPLSVHYTGILVKIHS